MRRSNLAVRVALLIVGIVASSALVQAQYRTSIQGVVTDLHGRGYFRSHAHADQSRHRRKAGQDKRCSRRVQLQRFGGSRPSSG